MGLHLFPYTFRFVDTHEAHVILILEVSERPSSSFCSMVRELFRGCTGGSPVGLQDKMASGSVTHCTSVTWK